MADGKGVRKEQIAATALWCLAVPAVAVLLWIIGDIAWHGARQLSWRFLVDPPLDAGRGGGIGPILVSTLLIVSVCMAAALPVGVGAAVLLAEFSLGRRRFAQGVRGSLDALAAVPSIVFGLFGNVFFCHILGLGFSILAGGLTLACMALPILVRTTEEALRAVPDHDRFAAAALGICRMTTLWKILLPAAAPGAAVGMVLGIGRAIAETAALLFTSGYVTRMPESLGDSGRSLSVHIYDLAMNVPGGNGNAYASALVLVAILLVINLVAVESARRWARMGTA